MGFLDNDTDYNPLFLEDVQGWEASVDEAMLDDDTQAELEKRKKKMMGYSEDESWEAWLCE